MTALGIRRWALCAYLALAGCGDTSASDDAGGISMDAHVAIGDSSMPSDADSTSDDAAITAGCECDDGVDCTTDACLGDGTCEHVVSHVLCGEGRFCDAERGCVEGDVCGDVSDCPSFEHPCVEAILCAAAARQCTWIAFDGDADGNPARVCGGTDCDDGDPSVGAGGAETCDGTDEDCDGVIDAPLPADACPPGASCIDGVCGCAGTGETYCGSLGRCVDLTSTPQACGSCEYACGLGATCVDSNCRCEAPRSWCSGSCVDLRADPANCGECGRTCPSGAMCAVGRCACPAGTVACGSTCATLVTDEENCGACGNRCLGGAVCDAGACSSPVEWAIGFELDRYSEGSIRIDRVVRTPDDGVAFGIRFRGALRELPARSIASTFNFDDATYLMRRADDGTFVWGRFIGRSAGGSGRAALDVVAHDVQGQLVMFGTVQGTVAVDDGATVTATTRDLAMLRYAADGSFLRSNVIRATGDQTVEQWALAADGEIVAKVRCLSACDFGGGVLGAGRSWADVVVRVGLDGSLRGAWEMPESVQFESLATSSSVIAVAGTFRGSTDFGDGIVRQPVGSEDAFVARYARDGHLVGVDVEPAESTVDGSSILQVFEDGGLLSISAGTSATSRTVTRRAPGGAVQWSQPLGPPPAYAAVEETDVDGAALWIAGRQGEGFVWRGGSPVGNDSFLYRLDAAGLATVSLGLNGGATAYFTALDGRGPVVDVAGQFGGAFALGRSSWVASPRAVFVARIRP